MNKYRKKSVVIEAIHHDGTTKATTDVPMWFIDALISRKITNPPDETDKALLIHTLEGVMRAELGDWILQDVKGELYPCKRDIFAALYDEEPEALQL